MINNEKNIDLFDSYKHIIQNFKKLDSSTLRRLIADVRDFKTTSEKKRKKVGLDYTEDELRQIKQVARYAGMHRVIELLEEKKKTVGRNIDFNDIVETAMCNYTEMFEKCVDGEVSYEDFYHFMGIYLFKPIEMSFEEYKNRTIK